MTTPRPKKPATEQAKPATVAPPKTVESEAETGPLYRGGTGEITVIPGTDKKRKIKADPTKEYVAGGPYYLAATYLRSLAFAIDDVTEAFGADLYDRMLLDGQVYSDINTLKMAILAEGVNLQCATDQWDVDPEDGTRTPKPEYPEAQEILEFCTRNLGDLCGRYDPETASSNYQAVYNLLDGMAFGYKIAEKVFEIQTVGTDVGRMTLRRLKCKPRTAAAFVVDPYQNLMGILALIPGNAMPVLVQALLGDPKDIPNLLPIRKFCVFTWRSKDSDPRGTSLLRGAYCPWFIKVQIEQERVKWLSQLAGGSVVGYTAPDATEVEAVADDGSPVFNPDGTLQMINPEQAMLSTLILWQNGTAAAFPNGAKVDVNYPPAESPFDMALDAQDRKITKAILGQTRATQEAEHGSKADSETGMDILGMMVAHGKQTVLGVINDILRDLVEYNFGPDKLHLMPLASLSKTQQHDFAESATAVGSLKTSNYLAPSQLPHVDAMLGLPVRTQEELASYAEMQQAGAASEPDGDEGGPDTDKRGGDTPSPINDGDGRPVKPAKKKPSPEKPKRGNWLDRLFAALRGDANEPHDRSLRGRP